MVDMWTAVIENSTSGHSAIIDVNMWLGKATLDACVVAFTFGIRGLRTTNREFISQRIGAGALGYDFGALDDADNLFTKSYMNLVYVRLSASSIV